MTASSWLTYLILLAGKVTSRTLWDTRVEWVGQVPDDPWRDVRLIAILHHTSLAEPVYLPAVPNRVLRAIARHGVAPVAEETMARPIAGRLFRMLVANPVSITRRRDDTWSAVMQCVDDPDAIVALCPEGRMMRPNGRDKGGEPMTVKRGIADVLLALGHGRMILAYSGGLHHVFPPGARLPRPFRPMKVRVESLDISDYIAERAREAGDFAEAVVRDLTQRRDVHTPIAPGTPPAVAAEVVRRRHRAWLRKGGRDETPSTTGGSHPAGVGPGPFLEQEVPWPTETSSPASLPDPQSSAAAHDRGS
jgi:hypothetical protein